MLYAFSFPKISKCEFVDLTKNTIILFSNRKLLKKIGGAFQNFLVSDMTKNDDEIDCYYETSKDNEELNIKPKVIYRDTYIYDVNNGEQSIILTIEPIAILSLKDKWDLWFVDSDNNDEIKFWPLTDFKGYNSHGLEDHTAMDIYEYTVNGRFGCFDGNYDME